MSDWFYNLVGFEERGPDAVRRELAESGSCLRSLRSGREFQCGQLEIASLQELRRRVAASEGVNSGRLQVTEVVGDVKALHQDATNAGALFQVASQFNLLEMVSPSVTPEQGIAIYEDDPTQGPACAIACGAGTIYRNYFVELEEQLGQSVDKQVDCLADVGKSLGNGNGQLWKMQNGYALPSAAGLREIDRRLQSMSEAELDSLRAKLKIGVQWNTQVTLGGSEHLVNQAYCSALPVAYSRQPTQLWERFARLILEAAYEATLAVAALNASKSRNKAVYLTLLGGGAFGNDQAWILDAIRRAAKLYRNVDLNSKIVSFSRSNPSVRELCSSL